MTNLARFDRSQPCPKCGAPERSVRWEPASKDVPERLIVRCRCGFADQFAPVDGGKTVSTLPAAEILHRRSVDDASLYHRVAAPGQIGSGTP